MEIRKFQKNDTKEVAELLHESVKILNPQESSEQTQSQTTSNLSFHNWEESFLEKFTIVAERKRKLVGIAQLDSNGHIDCFYCHPEYRRQGIGGQLYAALEDQAYSQNIPVLFTETNTEDIPFYLKMGFQKVQKQDTLINGGITTSFVLKKEILS